jgi:hypothetical protein
LIVAQFALAQNHQLTVYVFNVQLHAMFVVFDVKLAGQFVVVLHVYHVLSAVIVLHVSQ